MTSSAWVPMEPVAPSSTTSREVMKSIVPHPSPRQKTAGERRGQ
jgi:hypothetical protein